eukprot:6092827-Pleurochrysis_carterae.AAC.2
MRGRALPSRQARRALAPAITSIGRSSVVTPLNRVTWPRSERQGGAAAACDAEKQKAARLRARARAQPAHAHAIARRNCARTAP